jgi:hypothetical protein
VTTESSILLLIEHQASCTSPISDCARCSELVELALDEEIDDEPDEEQERAMFHAYELGGES